MLEIFGWNIGLDWKITTLVESLTNLLKKSLTNNLKKKIEQNENQNPK
jgi:hypothetical protein